MSTRRGTRRPAARTRWKKPTPALLPATCQQDPQFVGAEAGDFRLKEGSPLIDAGAFLTVTVGGGGNSRQMAVKDAGFFFDGFGIEGQQGDLIRLQGQGQTARVVAIDYRPARWSSIGRFPGTTGRRSRWPTPATRRT